ncbi:tyrosine-type recombinase/integrase [Spirosoma migulaei]
MKWLAASSPIQLEGNWNQALQQSTGRSSEVRQFNVSIDAIRTQLNAVYDRQIAAGLTPTATSVKTEYQTGVLYNVDLEVLVKSEKWSPINCYQRYLIELESGQLSEKKLEKTTLGKWRYGLTYLKTYVAQTQEANPLSIGSADELTLFWGKSYHRWLMKEGPMSADSATRYVNRLIESINYVAESGDIKQNPLANLKLSRGKTKDVYFLEPEHLARFWQLDLGGDLGVACWWMGVIFLTGLDYPDVVQYVQNREKYERETPFGPKIVIRRAKSLAECHIPMLPELVALLQRMPEGKAPSSDKINEAMKVVQALIGFQHRLTCKIGRKTAGNIFMIEYENVGAVSRMLGHSSVTITERYYVKTTGHTVDKVMQKRFVSPTAYQPFRRVA